MLRSIWFRRALAAFATIAACASLPFGAAAAPRGALILSGRVLDDAGAPVPQTWILVRGSRRLSALSDSAGAYRVTIPGGTVDEMAKSPLTIRVQARHKGMSLATRDGAPELGVEMRVRRDTSAIWRFQVRSNRAPVAALVAGAAMVEPNPRIEVSLDFRASAGAQAENLPVPLPAVQEVALVGPPPRETTARAPGARAAEPVAPDGPSAPVASRARTPHATLTSVEDRAAKGAKRREVDEARRRQRGEREEKARLARLERAALDSATASLATANRNSQGRNLNSIQAEAREAPDDGPPRSSSLKRIEPEIVFSRGLSRSVPATAASGEPGDACSCRVRGTLEVEADRRLPEAMKVDVFIDGLPAHTDTVELFMGSPRVFDLGWVPCGSQAVGFTTHSKQRFRLRSLAPFTCRPGTVQQMRLVLEPSRGRTALR
jgi:hypothetical protein